MLFVILEVLLNFGLGTVDSERVNTQFMPGDNHNCVDLVCTVLIKALLASCRIDINLAGACILLSCW